MEKGKIETMRLEIESLSKNEEFARVVVAVFMSRLDPTLEEAADIGWQGSQRSIQSAKSCV